MDLMLILMPSIGLFFLIYFTYQDWKCMEVENNSIFIFFLFSLIFIIFIEGSWLIFFLVMLMLILSIILWKIGSFGGADAKIIPAMIPFLLYGADNYIVRFGFFLMVFAIIGTIYGLIGKYFYKKEEIAFLPAITFTYFLVIIINLF